MTKWDCAVIVLTILVVAAQSYLAGRMDEERKHNKKVREK